MTPDEVRNMLLQLDDNAIKSLLLKGNLTVDPYDREKAINKISGLDGGCDSCNEKSKKKYANVTYVNGVPTQNCQNCNK